MATIRITARELMGYGIWNQACDAIGISSWAVNEGQLDMDDSVTLSVVQARDLGLLARWEAAKEET